MTDRVSQQAPARAGRREWIGLAVIALPCMLYSMDLTVLNLAVPSLSADLRPSAAQLLWIVDIYGFFVAGSLITMGSLGDRIGRRRLLLIGAAAFGAASILAALADSAATLIAARAILGVAGATLAPSTLSLIRNMFLDPGERSLAIGLWIASFSAGGALGPLLGGLVLTQFGWNAVFLLAVPVMAMLLVLGPWLLPEYRDPDAAAPLDLASVLMSMGGILALIYGVKRVAEGGWHAAGVAAAAAGVVLLALFLARQRRLSQPLVDPQLFRSRAFCAALAINVLGFFAMFAGFLFVAQYLQLVQGMDPLKAGLWSLPSALAFVAGSAIVPVLGRHVRPAWLMACGLGASAAGFLLLVLVQPDSALALVILGSMAFSLGLTPVVALTTDLVVGAVEPERAGSAAALSETSSELGGALGIALLGSLATWAYRSGMAQGMPQGLPESAAQVAGATLGGALSVAQALEPHQAAALLEAGRGAFLSGLHAMAAASAAILLATAVLAVLALRHVRPVAAQPA